MECKTIRRQVANFFLNASLIPKGDFSDILLEIDSLEPFEYKRGLSKSFLPHLSQRNLRFDKEIWKEIESNFSSDPFLWLLTGLTYSKLQDYQKSIELFRNFLQIYPGFCLNSFIIVKLMKCLIKTRKFQELVRFSTLNSPDLHPDHHFLVLCFQGYSFEMLGEKEKAKKCYNSLIDLNCTSSFACKFWLDVENSAATQSLQSLNTLIEHYDETSQIFKDLNLLKAFYFYKSNDFYPAIELLSKIWERNKNGFLCISLMGLCYYHLKNLRKSSTSFLISVYHNSSAPEAWFNLAKIYHECDNASAKAALDRMNQLDHGEIIFSRGFQDDFVLLPFNFAKICKVDLGSERNTLNLGIKRGRKFKVEDNRLIGLESDALLLCQLKVNKKKKCLEEVAN